MSDVLNAPAQLIDAARGGVVLVLNAERGVGTGVIWRSDARASLVLTNHHVVADGRGRIRVRLADGREGAAEILAASQDLDLALLQAPVGGAPALPFADSSALRVGELVLAIGNPGGEPNVVTAGVVSGFGKAAIRGGGRMTEYVRSDVVLAPGNSGGPLLNARGAVVGINAMILGGDLSVAIPSRSAQDWIVEQMARRQPAADAAPSVILV